MKPEVLSSCSQEPVAGTYHEPDFIFPNIFEGFKRLFVIFIL